MFCSQCGKKINENSKFCKYCGSSSENVNGSTKKTLNAMKKNKSKYHRIAWGAFFISVMSILLINIWVVDNKDQEAQGYLPSTKLAEKEAQFFKSLGIPPFKFDGTDGKSVSVSPQDEEWLEVLLLIFAYGEQFENEIIIEQKEAELIDFAIFTDGVCSKYNEYKYDVAQIGNPFSRTSVEDDYEELCTKIPSWYVEDFLYDFFGVKDISHQSTDYTDYDALTDTYFVPDPAQGYVGGFEIQDVRKLSKDIYLAEVYNFYSYEDERYVSACYLVLRRDSSSIDVPYKLLYFTSVEDRQYAYDRSGIAYDCYGTKMTSGDYVAIALDEGATDDKFAMGRIVSVDDTDDREGVTVEWIGIEKNREVAEIIEYYDETVTTEMSKNQLPYYSKVEMYADQLYLLEEGSKFIF